MDLKRLWHFASCVMDVNRIRNANEIYDEVTDEERGYRGIVTWENTNEEIGQSSVKMGNFTEDHAEPRAMNFEPLILNDNLKPNYCKNDSSFPHKGLMISALYFHESKNHLAKNARDDAWSSLTMAYYYLGMNSSPTTVQESASDAARTKSANIGDRLRSLIVEVTRSIPKDGSIKSASAAINLVVEIIENNTRYKEILLEFDSKTPAGTKKPKLSKVPSEPSDRLRNNLQTWMATSSRYPEIVEAFAPFKRNMGKGRGKTRNK